MSFLMIGETNFSRQYSHNVSKCANRSFYGIKISSSLCGWIKFDVPFFVYAEQIITKRSNRTIVQ